jgi:transposase-like protein
MEVKIMASKGQKFRKWSFEEKLRIVKRHTEDHISVRQLAKEEGTTDGMVCRWVQEYEEAGEEGLKPKRRGNPYAALNTSKSVTEVERLRLLVAKQEVEIERLKKGYWVEGAGVNKVYVTGCDKNTKLH